MYFTSPIVCVYVLCTPSSAPQPQNLYRPAWDPSAVSRLVNAVPTPPHQLKYRQVRHCVARLAWLKLLGTAGSRRTPSIISSRDATTHPLSCDLPL